MNTPTGTRRISTLDSVLLHAKTQSTMTHVASLLRFAPPSDATEDYLRALTEDVRRDSVAHSPRSAYEQVAVALVVRRKAE